MGIINVLPKEVSNKIAAGEVVERPASVVKELVENSIDAGATTISIEIKKGGSQYIRVSDNGKGMSVDDAKLCFLRHATSKIKTSSDLDAIYTLGFRGEALSSIGAVAKVSLYTKQEDGDGICVTCEGGEILTSEEAGLPTGTTMVVENLFFNTPARAKFLKKDSTEAGYITDIVTKCIFAHPEISFKLIVNGKEQLFSAGDNKIENAVYTVYGRDYAKGSLDVLYEDGGIKVSGIVGKGNIARPNRNYQSFFVNKRYVKSALMIRALEEAYKNQIMIGKFPMAILNVEINPELIDINVHPTKLEVKFSDEKAIYRAIYYAVKNALYALPNVPEIEHEKKADDFLGIPLDMMRAPSKPDHNPRANPFLVKKDTPEESPREILQKAIEEEKKTELPKQTHHFISPEKAQIINAIAKVAPELKVSDEETEEIKPTEQPAFVETPKAEYIQNEIQPPQQTEYVQSEIQNDDTSVLAVVENTEETPSVFDEYFVVVGQLFNSYIIIEKDDKMLLIDQHAAHERLKYEELLRDLSKNDIVSQMLLEPVSIKLSPVEMGTYYENEDLFTSLGFECEEFGENTVLIRSVPCDVEFGDIEELFVELLTQCENNKKELISARNERLTYTIACKAAIKANHSMSMKEMEGLVKEVFKLKNINTCPHGRPIVISMSKKEIEKEFKRIN